MTNPPTVTAEPEGGRTDDLPHGEHTKRAFLDGGDVESRQVDGVGHPHVLADHRVDTDDLVASYPCRSEGTRTRDPRALAPR